MAQASPSSLLYAQALTIIQQLQKDYASGKYQTPDQISALVNSAVSKFNEVAGSALTKFEPLYRAEIPSSTKMNRFYDSLQNDVNILQDQIDALNAAAIFMHNFIKTDVLKAQTENRALQNKLKTLELYTSVDDNSLLYFGDKFASDDFVDWNLVLDDERLLITSGNATLDVSTQNQLLNPITSSINILDDSNGFLGNNQEINDPSSAPILADNSQKIYTFKGETNRNADPDSILDNQPTSWLEFEKCWINPDDIAKAKSLNFEYYLTGSDSTLYLAGSNAANIGTTALGTISWANGPTDNLLKFYFEIDLGTSNVVNAISLLPFGLTNNTNAPLHVIKVSVSLNRTDWSILSPENVWVSNSIDKQISSINAENINVGSAYWVNNNAENVQFIRFEIEQPTSITANLGHLYYVTKGSEGVGLPNYTVDTPAVSGDSATYNTHLPYNSHIPYSGTDPTPADVTSTANSSINNVQSQAAVNVSDAAFREQGPVPPVDNPLYYTGNNVKIVNDLIQKREYFPGKRWAIGIRDIAVYSNVYKTDGIIVSKKFDIPGIVDRVAIEADVQIPSGYNASTNWIKFFVSPNNGNQWFEISRIQDDFLGLPEIIAFNDPTPTELREPGVSYQTVTGTVNSLRVKIEITRPEDQQNTSPVLKSYKLKVVKRG